MYSRYFLQFGLRLFLLGVMLTVPGGTAARADEIDAYLKTEMAELHIPGLSVCVVKDGRIVKAQTYGLANVELNVPATADTEFAIASMTKSVTASAIMLLVQDGKLKLDDPISKYFNGLPETWQTITIRQLLTHTSGIKDHFHDYPFFPIASLDRKLEYTDDEYLKALINSGLNFKPGAQWAYSGSGFTLLGMIITKVTGKPYPEFFRSRIFAPLGMTRTHVISLADIMPNRAAGYRWFDAAEHNGSYTGQTFSAGADVSLLTTAEDLGKWHVALSSGGLWTKASLEQMWTPATLSNGREAVPLFSDAWGLGWALGIYDGYALIDHSGSFMTGFSSFMGTIPDKRLTVIVLTNQHSADPLRLAFGVAGFYDAELLAPHRMTVQPDARPDLTVKVKAFMEALFSGKANGAATELITPGLRDHLPPVPELPAGEKVPLTDLSFIASADLSRRKIERHGAKIVAMSHYQAKLQGDTVYLTFYFTKDGEIAAYSGY